jgi:ribonuclease R
LQFAIYYKILYISNHEGEEFNGIISGVTNFGFFVELDNCIEGLVKIETLKGNSYRYDQSRYTLSNGNNVYKLGQQVRIKVAGVNILSRRAEFLLVDDDNLEGESQNVF